MKNKYQTFLLLASLLLPVSLFAVTVDVYQDMEAGSDGTTLTSALATTGTHGSGGSWSMVGSNLKIRTAGEKPLRSPITVAGGTTYSDSGSTRSWGWNDNVDLQYAAYTTTSAKSVFVISCYLTIGPGPGKYEIYDAIQPGVGSTYAIVQINSGSPTAPTRLWIETWQGATVHSPTIDVVAGTTYWVSFKADAAGGRAYMDVFEIVNWTKIGSVSVAMTTGTMSLIRFGRTDTHGTSSATTTYIDDVCINWTDTTFPFLPASASPTAPAITSHPASQTLLSGANATFSVTATGNPSPGYQWKKSGVALANGGQISGATSATLTVASITSTAAGSYTCDVSNSSGSVASTAGVLTVTPDTIAPTVAILSPAANATIAATTVPVSLIASDNVKVVGVQLKVNGVNSGLEDTNTPYAVMWNAATVGSGTHTLTAVARDASGNTTTSAASAVTVSAVAPVTGRVAGIPVQNAPTNTWASAGVPGGIPVRTTIYTTLNPGVTAAQIVSAMNSCPSNQVVYLSAGTYNLSSIDFGDPGPTYKTLRGAGMGQTILKISSGAAAINTGSYPPWFGTWSSVQDVTAGGNQGSTTITVPSASSYVVGDMCVVDMANAGWIQGYGTGGTTTPIYNNDSSGKGRDGNRSQLHLCRITGKSGNDLSFDPPLPYDLDATRAPQISRASQRPGPISFGIEDMTVDATGAGGQGIFLNGSYASWLKNIEMKGWGTFGIFLRWNLHFEMRGCYIHNPESYAVSRGYGAQLDPCSSSLVIDNIFYDCQSTILLQGGCTGNVLAYNVFAFGKYVNGGYTGEWLQHEINGNHTPFPAFNLFEGNYTGSFQVDYYYGASGWGTVYRNRIPGNSSATTQHRICVSIDSNSRGYSVVGNQLGERVAPASLTLAKPGVTRTYTQPGTISWSYDPGSASFSTPYIYRLGYPYSGNNSTSTGTAVQDYVVKTNTLRHGNWDAANNAVVWDASITDRDLPASLFLNSKPAWFGNLAWPPYGPEGVPSGPASDLEKIPAGYRLVNNLNPPGSTSGNQAPTSIATATTATTGLAPLTVAFSSSGSSDPEGTPLSYSWNFGDGTSATTANPSRTFTTAGSYAVRLTVSDGTNSTLSAAINISVTAPVNNPPVVVANASPKLGVIPLLVSFNSTGSSDPEGSPLTYSWNFGDGTTSTAANPTHTYSTAGTFSARLTISDGANSVSSANIGITASATATNYPPVAVANGSPPSGAAPLAVSFSSSGSSDPEGAMLTYNWNFGDGTANSTLASPVHTYSSTGSYTAMLTVSDGTNSATSTAITITVATPLSGLVAAYSFDEGAGGSTTDASGKNNTGTVSNATWTTAGKYGGALTFNGTNALVVIPNSTSLNVTNEITQAAWVYPTASKTGWSTVMHRETDAYYLHASSPAGAMLPASGATFGGTESYLAGTSVLPLNTWSHIASTYDSASLKIYINGVLSSTKAVSGSVQNNTNPLRIGGNFPYGQFFEGRIDEVRVYNRALSAAEIVMAKDNALPGSTAPTPPATPQNLRIVSNP